MNVGSILNLTDAERGRIDHIDRLVALGEPSVGELLDALSDPSWTVRRAAVAGLAALGDDAVSGVVTWLRDQRTTERGIAAAVDTLAASIGSTATASVERLLEHPDPAVAADAAAILGRRHSATSASRLAAALTHQDDNVAVAAIEALGTIGGSVAVEPLISVVHTRNFFRTFPALQVLARTGDPRSVPPLADLLEDELYRVEAARALGRTGSALAIRPLASMLRRSDEPTARVIALALSDLLARAGWVGAGRPVAEQVRAVLGSSVDQLIALLPGADPTERIAVANVLGAVGDTRAIQALVALLADPATRAAATTALGDLSRTTDAPLVDILLHGDSLARTTVLPMMHSIAAAPALRTLLEDDDAEVRARAAEALARVGDRTAVAALFDALDDANPRVAHAATSAIHSLAVPATSRLAIAGLASDHPAKRRHCLRIIAYLGYEQAYAAVRVLADDHDLRISELAVAALAAMEHPDVDGVLRELARSPRESIRAAVMRAVAQRPGDDKVTILLDGLADDAAWVRYYACQGLGRIGRTSSTSALVTRLADAVPHVRIAAIEALARIATDQAWQALASAARSEDVEMRRAALTGLGNTANVAALPFLLDGAGSEDIATHLVSLAGLARIADPRALAQLVVAAESPTPELREAAVSLLAERTDRAGAEALIDLALRNDPAHPAHAALSRPDPERIAAVGARLGAAIDPAATLLAAALSRMADRGAVEALFSALASASPAARRAAATSLIAIDAAGARQAVARLATHDPDPDVRRACAAAGASEPWPT